MKTRWMLAFACLLGLGVGSWLTADDAAEGDAEAAKPESYCADLSMAMDLVAYGREHNAPEALICAARIIGTTPTTEDSDNFVCETEHAEDPQGAASAEALLEEASAMSDAPHIQALVAQVTDAISETERGEVGGPGRVNGCVGDHQTQEWHGDFYGGEWAEVTINGDGYSDLDVRVFDDRGYLIAEDNSTSPNCHVHWYQRYTGHVHIEVHCYESFGRHVHYTLYHN